MEKKFNRILSFLLALVMVVGMLPMPHVHAEEEHVDEQNPADPVICEHSWDNACDTDCNNGCGEVREITHDWTEATCVAARTCSGCGATEGEALGHNWVDADCDTPKTCSGCGATEGEALGHSWVDADCDTPKTCSGCGTTEGEATGEHDFSVELSHEDGYITYKCANCEATTEVEEEPAADVEDEPDEDVEDEPISYSVRPMIEYDTASYRWDYVPGEGLVSKDGDGYTRNDLTVTSGLAASKEGTLTNYLAQMATTAVLRPTEPWYIEWKATGYGAGTYLLSATGGLSKNYVYYNSSSIFALGQSSDDYWNLGFKTTEEATYIDMNQEHIFRFQNEINEDGSNSVWLWLDGEKFFEMNSRCYRRSALQETFDDWLNGYTLEFPYIGTVSGMKLKYLEISESGTVDHTHYHSFGDWSLSADGTKFERSCACGDKEYKDIYGYRWEMNEAGTALVNVVSGQNVANELLNPGTISNGTLSGYRATFETPVTLLPTDEWVIEWKSTNQWTGMMLSGTGDGKLVYLYGHNVSGTTNALRSVGIKDGDFLNTGIGLASVDMTEPHVFRIENKIGTDGMAMAYLYVDGVLIGAMENRRIGSAATSTVSNAVYNLEGGLTFTQFGGDVGIANNLKLDYLQIWPNGAAHQHAYTASEAAGKDCQSVGVTTYTCSCGDSYTKANTLTGDHAYGEWVEVNGNLVRECGLCDASESEAYTGYYWEMNEDGTALDNVVEGIFKENTLSKTTGEITDGTLSMYKGSFATPLELKADKEWAIEWVSSGAWNTYNTGYGGVFLANGTTNYMYYNRSNVFAIGRQDGANKHYGFKTSDTATAIDMTAKHTFRLENRVNDDGTNEVWLVLDNVDFFEMDSQLYHGSALQTASDNWLNGHDLTFTTIGNGSFAGVNNMKLEYLKVWLNTPAQDAVHTHNHVLSNSTSGADCQSAGVDTYTCSCGDSYTKPNTLTGDHVYGEWAEVNGNLVRECGLCDASESEAYTGYYWKMNEDGTALDNVVSGIFAENALTKTAGSIENGVLDTYKGSFENSMALDSSREWVIEWKSSGDFNTASSSFGSVFLSTASTTDGYIYYNVRRIFSIGHNAGGSTYHNFGFDMDDYPNVDMTAEHIFRLENRVNEDGSNEIWLMLDGNDFFNMGSQWYVASEVQSGENDWLIGRDITITQIGNSLCGTGGMDLEYLKVWLNTPAEEDHTCDFSIKGEVTPGADCTTVGTTVWACSCGKTVTLPNTVKGDHSWKANKGIWAEDGSQFTVEGICSCGETTTLEAGISSEVTTVAICEKMGSTTYTASITEEWAKTYNGSTKTIQDVPALDHSYTGAIKSDGNGKDATHSFLCVNGCNQYGGAVNHTWNAGKETTAPGCTAEGVKTFTCTAEGCGATYTDTIPATGHTFGETVAAKDATCKAGGNEAYKQCTSCKLYFAADADKNSTEGKESVDAFATGKLDHEYEYDCSKVCELCSVETRPNAQHGNFSYADNYDNGHDVICGFCNETVNTESHELIYYFEGVFVDYASITMQCSKCMRKDGASATPETMMTPGTCQTKEVTTYTFDFAEFFEYFAADGYVNPVYAPEMDQGIEFEYTVDEDAKTLTFSVEGNFGDHKHELTDSTAGADCVTPGVDTYTCACGDSYTEDNNKYGDHAGYEVTDSTTGADCVTPGVDTYTCACGDSYTKANETFGDHTYTYDCDTVCSICKKETRPDAQHVLTEFVEQVYGADCQTNGYDVFRCEYCGKTENVENDTAKGDHVYTNDCDTVCSVCEKETRPEAVHITDSEYDCVAGKCQYCGTDMEATADHSYTYDCDTKCAVCGGGEREADHTYTYDCDTVCSICEKETRPDAQHGYYRNCSKNCRYCGQETRPEAEHMYEHECDKTCEFCGEETRPEAQHGNFSYDFNCEKGHNLTCGFCKANCGNEPHEGTYFVADITTMEVYFELRCVKCDLWSYINTQSVTETKPGTCQTKEVTNYIFDFTESLEYAEQYLGYVNPVYAPQKDIATEFVYTVDEEAKTLTITVEGDFGDHIGYEVTDSTTGADCVNPGVDTYTCACGDSYTEDNNKYGDHAGYEVTDSTTGADCVTPGVDTYSCACGDSYTKDNDKFGDHNHSVFVETVNGADCQTDGHDVMKCDKCDNTINKPNAEAKGDHIFGEWTYDVEQDKVIRTCACEETEVAVVSADINGEYTGYETLEDALEAAEEGSIVSLWDDVSIDVLELNKGISLELQGHTLTTGAAFIDSGNEIMDYYQGVGLLKVAKGNIIITPDHQYLPIWNGTDGYVFASTQNYQEMTKTADNTVILYFLPELLENFHDYLAAGMETSGVKLKIDLSWTKDDTEYFLRNLTYNDDLMKRFCESYDAETGKYALAFKLTVTGTDIIDEGSLDFRVYFEADCGVEYELQP